MTKLEQLIAQRAELKPKADASWKAYRELQQSREYDWITLDSQIQALDEQISREKMRLEVLSEMQAEQEKVVRVSTVTEGANWPKLES